MKTTVDDCGGGVKRLPHHHAANGLAGRGSSLTERHPLSLSHFARFNSPLPRQRAPWRGGVGFGGEGWSCHWPLKSNARTTVAGWRAAAEQFASTLEDFVKDTIREASEYVDALSVDDRNQVRQYYTPLWIWHRLDQKRWAMSSVPLRAGRKEPSLDIDHAVAVALWKELGRGATPANSDEDPSQAMNELGNCLLLERAFNISKGKKALAEWLNDVHEFQNGTLTQDEWAEVWV